MNERRIAMRTPIIMISTLVAIVALSGCGFLTPPVTALWADVHPQGWVVFTGSRPPFPPPSQPYSYAGYDDKLLLFHPHLGTTITILEDASGTFSWPRWSASPYSSKLYWISNRGRVYRLAIDFSEIERAISDPLQSRPPLTLEDAELLWTDEGAISALAPSPDGKLLAFLREYDGQFTVVVLNVEESPAQKIAELPTVWLPGVLWTPDSHAVLLAHETPERFVALGDQQIPLGTIVRHEITTAEETVLVRDVALYNSSQTVRNLPGLGPIALAPDGSTLYYVTLARLRLQTAQDLRLGLYGVDLVTGARKLLMEFPPEEGGITELVAAPGGQRLAFTRVGYHVGVGFSVQSALYVIEGDQLRQLTQLLYGWFFPLWLNESHLAYVQFQFDIGSPHSGVRPALWVHNVETGERFDHLPLLRMQEQIESLRQAIRRLHEQIRALEQALRELQAHINK
jgi:hypothetical protein